MSTYRSEDLSHADVTTWLYDEATGLTTNKVYADGKGPTYTYTPDGLLATRTWARGIVTAYSYDTLGTLVSVDYSDTTPDIAYTRDRLGNVLLAVTDGVATNAYAYNRLGQLTNEVQNGTTIARSYDALGRATGYAIGDGIAAGSAVSYAYDTLGRFASVSSGTNVFSYSYLPGSDLVSGMAANTGHARERIYEPDRDLIATVHNRYGDRTISRFDYTNDEIGRRIARVDSGEAFAETAFERYSYNDRSEVIGSQRFYGADIDDLSRPVTGRTFGYGYDPIAISRSLATRRRKAARPPDSVPEPPLGRKKWPSDEFLTKSGLTTPSIHRGEMLLYLRCRRNARTGVRPTGKTSMFSTLETTMNSTTTQTQLGSRWWKIDFHVHTPASRDYGHGDQAVRESTCPEEILRAAMERRLDAIVVTDHNSGEWVDKLQKANQALQAKRERPAWYRDLVIFPGVEVSVAGGQNRIHVLALFNPGVGGNTIAGLLGKCGISENYGDDQKTTTKTSMEDTIRHIVEFGAIPILAHADKEKGYLHGVSCLPDNGKVFHGTCRVFAAELADLHAFDTHISPDVRKVMNSLAKVGGSDAHSPNEIGKFSSWVKMSSPSVASMRLALQSPEWSVKNQDENPNQEPNLVLQKLTISDMKYCGRINDAPCEVSFNPHQTSLIGGRGSGKSTIVESLRIALSQDTALDPALPKVQGNIDAFMERAPKTGGVMLDSTKIELDLRRNDEQFKLSWSASDGSHRIQRRQGDEWVEDQGDPRERFSVIVLSQKQIEEIADNPFGLLGIIDKRIGKGDWDEKWQQAHTQFVQLRERERELQRKLQEEPDLRAQLADVESDLSQFEKRGDGEILKRYQRQTLQWNAIVEDNVFDALTSELRAIEGKFSLPDFPSNLFDENDSALVEQKSLHDSIAMELNQVRAQLETVIGQIDAIKASWVHRITESAWHHDVEDVTAKYKELAEEYAKKNSRLDMSVYNEWIEKRNSLLSRLKQVESVRTELLSVKGQISELSQGFLDLRKELLNLRRRFIESAIGGNQYVKMMVVPFGNIGDLESTYRELLALEAGKYKDAILSDDKKSGILSGFSKWAEDVNCNDNDLLCLIETLKNDTMAIVKGEKSTDGWLMRKLKGEYEQRPQSFDNLLSWFPEDNLRVKYARSDSSKEFVDLKQGSAGQKAAAILAFLLSNGDEPLIIDQPEDDLDNALIYDLVVKQLHESKNRRQVIVATHNPNIVVNGDSELVHAFHFKNGQIQKAHSGGLDDKNIREDICTIMEGGREAFERRYKRMEIDQT